jgi:acyl-CoA reductase-like NAD-dependent aldehyde dehydrogenase
VGGNTVLLKPSNNTPVIAAELVRLCIEAGFPPGVFNLVTGRGSEVGERLIASPQIDFIAFTGSMEVGSVRGRRSRMLSAAFMSRIPVSIR